MRITTIFVGLLLCGVLRSWAQGSCAMQIQILELPAQKKSEANHQDIDVVLPPGTTISLKLKPHIIRRSNGTGGLTTNELNLAMQQLNEAYQKLNVIFDLCTVNYIDNDGYYSGIDYATNKNSEEFDMAHSNRVDDAVNVFFIPNTVYCGWSSFPFYKGLYDKDWTVMKNSCATNGSTFAHEIGHYLDLFHTHETSMGIENVSKPNNSCNNCNTTGDLLCDTPADPKLSNLADLNCNYTGNNRDTCGIRYEPDTSNIMSYSSKACRKTFSTGQIQRMLTAITVDRRNVAVSCSECIPYKTITTNVPAAAVVAESVQKNLTVSNTIGIGAKANYDAGDRVLLKRGFHAVSGSFFRAFIEGCSLIPSAAKQLVSKKEIDQNRSNHNSTTSTEGIALYPNPSKGTVYINLEKQSDATLQVYQLNGQLVIEKSYKNIKTITLNDVLPQSGMYVVRVITNDQNFVKRLVKQ